MTPSGFVFDQNARDFGSSRRVNLIKFSSQRSVSDAGSTMDLYTMRSTNDLVLDEMSESTLSESESIRTPHVNTKDDFRSDSLLAQKVRDIEGTLKQREMEINKLKLEIDELRCDIYKTPSPEMDEMLAILEESTDTETDEMLSEGRSQTGEEVTMIIERANAKAPAVPRGFKDRTTGCVVFGFNLW